MLLVMLALPNAHAADGELTPALATTLLKQSLAAPDTAWFDVHVWAWAVVMPVALNGYGGPPPTDGMWMLEPGHDAEWVGVRDQGATILREALAAGGCTVSGVAAPLVPAKEVDPLLAHAVPDVVKLDRLVHASLSCRQPVVTRWGSRMGVSDTIRDVVFTRSDGQWRIAGIGFASEAELWLRLEEQLRGPEAPVEAPTAARPGPLVTRWAPPQLPRVPVAAPQDLNNNGRPDVVLGQLSPGILSVLVDGKVVRIAQKFRTTTFGDRAVVAGDLTGDGHPDLVIDAPGSGDIPDSVWVVPGGRRFAPGEHLRLDVPDPKLSGFGQKLLPAGDLDGDGRTDLIVGAVRRTYIYFGGALDTPGGQIDAPPGFVLGAVVPAGDVDGDGAADIWIQDGDSDEPRMFLLHGGPIARVEAVPALDRVRPVASVRLSGEAQPALVAWVIGVQGETSLFRGSGTAWARSWGSKEEQAEFVIAADVTGDSNVDLLVPMPYAKVPELVVLAADGSTVLRLAGPPDVKRFGSHVEAPGDVDRDGTDDLLIRWTGGAGLWHLPLASGAAPVLTWSDR